jgi:hypothetical protein
MMIPGPVDSGRQKVGNLIWVLSLVFVDADNLVVLFVGST